MKEVATQVIKLANYNGATITELKVIWETDRGNTVSNTFWHAAGDTGWYTKDGSVVNKKATDLLKMLGNIEQRELDKAAESQQ